MFSLKPPGALAFFIASTLAGPLHAGPDKDACLGAFVNAQRERKGGELLASKRDLQTCADAACPAAVKTNCATWLGEVEASTPTVVLAARDERDRPIAGAQVAIDGGPLERVSDQARPLDPGKHELRFAAGARSKVVEVDLREGERDHPVVVRLAPAPLAPVAVVTRPPPLPSRPPPPPIFVFGGLAAVGLGVFVGSGLAGRANLNALDRAHCAPRCDATHPGNVSAVRRDYVIADVGLAGAAVSLGLATLFYLTRPTVTEPSR
jgi:hypothetical protein